MIYLFGCLVGPLGPSNCNECFNNENFERQMLQSIENVKMSSNTARKTLNEIQEHYTIESIACAGENYGFDENGRHSRKGKYKFVVTYYIFEINGEERKKLSYNKSFN